MSMKDGRDVKGNRGIGSGSKSQATSTSKPASGAPGIKAAKGGGKTGGKK